MPVSEQAFTPEPLTAECRNWYAVYTRSRHEKIVKHALMEKGIESFLPLRRVLSQWKDRRKSVEKPLFPGYLFVRVQEGRLYLVTMTKGAVYVLGNGDKPIPVPDEQIEAVRRLMEGPYAAVLWPYLQKGKRVRIGVGSLAGLEAYIIERKGSTKCRLIVSLDLLGRSVAVELDVSCVEPI